MSFMSSLRGYPSHTHELPLLLSTTFSIDFFFFFQAEDGIRDGRVTGVQTCALPISGDLPELAEFLREVASQAWLAKYPRTVRGPKKPPPKRASGRTNHHVSTARLLHKQVQQK